jgi:hypothetical protein
LDGVFKIFPIQIKRLIDIIVSYSSRVKNLQYFFYSLFYGFFTKLSLGYIENVGN